VRLAHPFPSLLNAVATAAIAALAGGDPWTILRLFGAMLGIQIAIGALNDVADVKLDTIAKPRKPIPSGFVGVRVASSIAIAAAVAGVGLSAMSGIATAAAAAACIGLGWLYDLRLSRTTLSWLPLAIALPILPIHAWLGVRGAAPDALLLLVPIGILGGAGLALANGLVDIDRDAGTGRRAVSVVLGARRAWLAHAAVLGLAAALAVWLAPGPPLFDLSADPGTTWPVPLGLLRAILLGIGCLLLVLGAALLRSTRASRRERGWEIDAIGIACLGLGWLAGTAAELDALAGAGS
jgi:4-hydroxybenzoate polyprenyltransferase